MKRCWRLWIACVAWAAWSGCEDRAARRPDGGIEPDPQCEGGDLRGETCQSQGYACGELRCNEDGTFDLSGCLRTWTPSRAIGSAVEPNGRSWEPSISADGRFVAFTSTASNLASGDTRIGSSFPYSPWGEDVFVADVQTGEILLASSARAWASLSAISGDGRYVAFAGAAKDWLSREAVFVRDLDGDTTTAAAEVIVEDYRIMAVAISGDGQVVAYQTGPRDRPDPLGEWGVFVHDLGSGTTVRADVGFDGSPADARASDPTLNADGRFVAFSSAATNLLPGPVDGPSATAVYVRDLAEEETIAVSVAWDDGRKVGGSSSPSISADGSRVAFQSSSELLVPGDVNGTTDIFVRDLAAGETLRTTVAGAESLWSPSFSPDGQVVAFTAVGPELEYLGFFAWDVAAGTTWRVDAGVAAEGCSLWSNTTLAAEGRLAFDCQRVDDRGVVDDSNVFVTDTSDEGVQRIDILSAAAVQQPDGNSFGPRLAAGQMAYWTVATNLLEAGTSAPAVVVLDEATGAPQALTSLEDPISEVALELSADGRVLAVSTFDPWRSDSARLWVHDLDRKEELPVHVAPDGSPGNRYALDASVSADGRFVAFTSNSTNLVPGGPLGQIWLVYVRDLESSDTMIGSVPPGPGIYVGPSCRPSLSQDARRLAFATGGCEQYGYPTDLYVRDLDQEWTVRVGPEDGEYPGPPLLSGDGSTLVYPTFRGRFSDGMVRGEATIVIVEIDTGDREVIREVAGDDGYWVWEVGGAAAPNHDGSLIVLSTDEALVPEDTNGMWDVYLYDRAAREYRLVSVTASGSLSDGDSIRPRFSADEQSITFESWATNLVEGTNGIGVGRIHVAPICLP